MRHTLALAAALALCALPAAAQPAPGVKGVEGVQPGVYLIDTKETLVRYSTLHMGLNEFWGTFPGAKGALTLDPANVAAAQLDVTVPIATVETTNRELNGLFFSDQFFDADKYPTMHFVSTSVTRTGERTAKLAGNLTLHGITRPVMLDVTFNGAGPNAFSKVLTLGFNAEGVVKRSDFGMGKYVPIVSDATTITISAALELKK